MAMAREEPRVHAVALGLTLLACLLYSHWRALDDLIGFWQRNEDYSVGMLVPFVAAWMVWRKRSHLKSLRPEPSYAGLALLAFAEGLRLFGLYFGVGTGERLALVLSVAGCVWLVAGRQIFWTLRWVMVFLCLMIPLPARVHEMVALPLQKAATSMTVFGLEMVGFFVVREGNVLRLNETTTVAVTEACSGLRMLTAFVFVAAVLAFLIRRPRWERIIIVALGVPIAVLSNGIRGFVTACFMHYTGSELASKGFHDVAGWAMMPLALLLFLGAVRLMDVISPADRTQPANVPKLARGRAKSLDPAVERPAHAAKAASSAESRQPASAGTFSLKGQALG